MTYIGIDISKATFVAAFPDKCGYRTETFRNDAKGIHSFIRKLDPAVHHCVMEATGNYCFLLLYLLDKASVKASLVNPKKIRNYAKVMMSVTKTDSKDAALIADFGERLKPEPYVCPPDKIMLLKQRKTVIRQLRKQLTATVNLRKSLDCLPLKDKKCFSSMEHTVAFLEKQMAYLQQEMEAEAAKAFDTQVRLLTSIKGIGLAMATALIIATSGFTNFENAKQLSRYIGICPTIEQSGTSVNKKGHINRNGDPHLRAMLYLCAWSASQSNPACKEMYERLTQKGKSGKVAMVAVANKLVRQAFAVIKTNTPYDKDFKSTKPASAI